MLQSSSSPLWPAWVDTVTGLSHLTLTVSCSSSFYIYFALYGTRHEVDCFRESHYIILTSYQPSLDPSAHLNVIHG